MFAVPLAKAALLGGVAFGFEATAPQWGLELRLARPRLRWLQGVVAVRSVVAYDRRDTIRVIGATTGSAGACLAATGSVLGGAACLGAELGSIEPRRFADFFLVPGNPVEDLKAIKTIRMVSKGDTVYFPSEIYPYFGIRPFAEAPAVAPPAGK